VSTRLGYHDFTLSGFFSERTKEVPTGSFGTIFNDRREETIDRRAYADLKYDHAFNEEFRLQGRAFYDYSAYYGAYPYNYAAPGDPPDHVLFRDGQIGHWVGTEWQLTARVLDRHTVVLGGEFRENLREYQFSYDDSPRFYYLDDDRTSRTLGLFAQAEAVLRTNLLLTAGLRYDHYFESFGGTLNPRLGLIYSPWETTTFKALFGQAFRAPNPYERFYNPEQQTRPELDPETIRTYELVYEQYLGQHYRLNISGYYYDVEDLISQTGNDEGDVYFDNLDQVEARGVELELEGKFDSGLLARISYARQRTEDGETGRELSSSPRHLAKLNLSVPIYRDKIFTGLELQYHGAVKTITGRRESDFLTANLTLFSHQIIKNLEVSASVYNLFDAKYGYPGAEDHLQDVIRQDGRSFRIKLNYKF
jgi:outer membrane receptor for ferrienterochelin and colicins